MNQISVVFCCAVALLINSCATSNPHQPPALGGMEIIRPPRPAEFWMPGSKWRAGLGPIDSPPSDINVLTGDGLQSLDIRENVDLTAGINLALTEWFTASAGSAQASTLRIEAKDLKHFRVANAYSVLSKGEVLWEVVTASELLIQPTNTTSSSGLDLHLFEAAIKKLFGNAGSASVNVKFGNAGSYAVARTERPVILAIKVARFDLKASEGVPRIVPLASVLATEDYNVGFGYQLSILNDYDYLSNALRVSINNSDLPRFEGEKVDFHPGTLWVNKFAKEAIGTRDSTAKKADYIWDTIRFSRANSNGRIQASRQYISVVPIKSGF